MTATATYAGVPWPDRPDATAIHHRSPFGRLGPSRERNMTVNIDRPRADNRLASQFRFDPILDALANLQAAAPLVFGALPPQVWAIGEYVTRRDAARAAGLAVGPLDGEEP